MLAPGGSECKCPAPAYAEDDSLVVGLAWVCPRPTLTQAYERILAVSGMGVESDEPKEAFEEAQNRPKTPKPKEKTTINN